MKVASDSLKPRTAERGVYAASIREYPRALTSSDAGRRRALKRGKRRPPSQRHPRFDFHRRSSGILLHITSLPGPHGSGDLGPESHRFVKFLADAGQSWWQTLPIGPPGRAPAFSPYDSPSAFAGSPWLVSLEVLARRGLLGRHDLRPADGLSSRQVNFQATLSFREARLREAFANFQRSRGEGGRAFRKFCEANADWLDDFALFMALRRVSGGKPWTEWEKGIRIRNPSALRAVRERLANEIAAHRFVQFEFDRQWRELRRQAQRRGIGLIGDLPIFAAHDSADVWSHPELFQLDGRGEPRRVSGYPPDRFNRNGQHWGHPQYDWAAHERTRFAWWVRRFERMFDLFDAVRIDHFLGFTRTWSIPARARNARAGRWVKTPGAKLFAAVESRLGPQPMIAEDLGHVTAADIRLRDAFGFAPMRILQFGFGTEPGSAEHLPHNYARLCAAYTGNHDNNTIVGWFRELSAAQEERALTHLGEDREAIHTNAIRVVMASPANLVVFPMQDVLGLNQRARMNKPGTAQGNWSWRLPAMNLASVSRQLLRLTEAFARNGSVGKHVVKADENQLG